MRHWGGRVGCGFRGCLGVFLLLINIAFSAFCYKCSLIQMLKSIDVFSGIGGLSLALSGITRTMLYCELDPFCRSVLAERMKSGDLERAPIHTDIRDLQLPSDYDAQVLVGGFPCQDISTMGLQKGIVAGKRSSMFFEMMRIVDECKGIDVIFMENVSNVLKCGLKEVIEECCVKRDFDLMWTMRSARDMGAPHVRQRWFGLACKRGFVFDREAIAGAAPAHFDWENQPAKKCAFKPSARADDTWDPAWAKRSAALGNAVVPCTARSAFLQLAGMQPDLQKVGNVLRVFSVDVAGLSPVQEYPGNGLVVGGRFLCLPENTCVLRARVPHSIDIHVQVDSDKVIRMGNFPTPRHGNTHAAAMTDRATRDLPTVLVNCKDCYALASELDVKVAPGKMAEVAVPNVTYIEWMMGFPQDWTKTVPRVADEPCGEMIEKESTGNVKRQTDAPWKNGFHVFMEANPGKNIKEVAALWRALPADVKEEYKARRHLLA